MTTKYLFSLTVDTGLPPFEQLKALVRATHEMWEVARGRDGKPDTLCTNQGEITLATDGSLVDPEEPDNRLSVLQAFWHLSGMRLSLEKVEPV